MKQVRSILVLVAIGPWIGLAEPVPCATNPDSRQLDYWVGDWVVTKPGVPGSSTSKVDLSLDKCMVVESWTDGKGHNGENMFAYSPDDKSWHGMFVDNRGHAHVFAEGKVAGGTAEFDGPSRGENGETVLNRIKVVRLAPGKVAQTWEKSTDNGITWTTVFRGEYSRVASKAGQLHPITEHSPAGGR